MPSEPRYSLFPPPDHVLQNQSIKRLTARPKTPVGQLSSIKRQPSMRTIREEDRVGDSPSAIWVTSPLTTAQSPPPVINVQNADASASSATPEQSSTAHPREQTVASPSQMPATDSSFASPPPDRPLPRAPGSTSAPRARAPALKTSSPSSAQPIAVVDYGKRHERNNTGDSASTSKTFKYSPVSPESLASPGSMFSPITPASDTTSVSYPLIPKMASSPSPSVSAGWSPPRRSNTRSSNSTSRTYNTSQSRLNGSDAVASYASPSLYRSPSAATIQSRRPSAPVPESQTEKAEPGFRSMFPTWNPDVPLERQDYRPNFSWTIPHSTQRPHASSRPSMDASCIQQPHASSRPSMDASSIQRPHLSSRPSIDESSTHSRLTEENLRALDQPATMSSSYPPRSTSVPNFIPQPTPPAQPPHRDAQAPKPKSATAQADEASLPTFAPPPQQHSTKTTTTATITSRTANPKQAKLKISRPHTKMVLAKRPKANSAGAKLTGSTTWQSTTTAVTKIDDKDGRVTTTATTTLARGDDNNNDKTTVSRWAPTHASDGPDPAEEAPEGVQHGMTVALGAVAFVMGVGVEVMGGAVGGLRRKKGVKEKAEKA